MMRLNFTVRGRASFLSIALLHFSLSQGVSFASERFQFKNPERIVYSLSRPAERTDWLEAAPVRADTGPVEFGNRIALQLKTDTSLNKIIGSRPLKPVRMFARGFFILEAPDPWTAAEQARELAALPEILISCPVMRKSAAPTGKYAPKPDDQWYPKHVVANVATQWYLENRGLDGYSEGMDLNVRSAWPFAKGKGVTVAVADTGMEFGHPDLLSRAQDAPHFNFYTQDTNAVPFSGTSNRSFWTHGTSVAGLIAAQGYDGKGMIGVAPEAHLASWVIQTPDITLVSDEALADMFQAYSNRVDVQNHSWDLGVKTLSEPSPLEKIAISNAIESGRDGKGVIIVRSAGNDRNQEQNANEDAYANDPRVITVAAVKESGRVIDASNLGACLLVAAPAQDNSGNGLFTADLLEDRGVISFPVGLENPDGGFIPTDLWNYRYNSLGFSGTSAAAPLISGVAALILSANPNLTYRDVQQILIHASRHFDLDDPDAKENGAGFRFSHNVGFGIPDAGFAVQLARTWPNRPPMSEITRTLSRETAIPDDGLRLEITGDNIPAELQSIHTSFAQGSFPDDVTAELPLVDVGLAADPISVDLTGKGALIERGEVDYIVKLQHAADAGAEFAVIYNRADNGDSSSCPGGDFLCPIGGAEFSPIPAVSIGRSAGLALIDLFENDPSARARIHLQTADFVFDVAEGMICEHVGVRVKTDHPLRGDLRITLHSPQGSRSVLQSLNQDLSPGPEDWIYYSARNFYESSVGEWMVSFSDLLADNAGNATEVSLIIQGVPITDSDADGLNDDWEMSYFDSLDFGPKDDPDEDGLSNSREQITGTDPTQMDIPFEVVLSPLDPTKARLSWPSQTGETYEIWGGDEITNLQLLDTVTGDFPETEWITSSADIPRKFFQIRAP